MNHPYITNLNAQEKYNRMLNDAEVHRQVKRITAGGRSFFKSLFSLIRKPGQSSADKVGTTKKVRSPGQGGE